MARTRAEIKTLVESHTGHTKDTLENSLCDTALKVALMQHAFKDAQSSPSDITITTDAVSVDISAISDLVNIVTARLVQADGTKNQILKFKTKTWWDEFVVNAEDNQGGWPTYGSRWGDAILLDRPAEAGIELRLRVTTIQTFTNDATVCPIALLDVFVEQFVTAGVFADLENWESSKFWNQEALGMQYKMNGKVGGQLANAINTDTIGDTALDLASKGPGYNAQGGVAIKNLNVGHEDYGNTRTWWS